MAKAKMPESHGSGQCDPVTGDPLRRSSTSSSASPTDTSPAMPLRMISPTSTSTTFDNSHFLPLSPPSTPSTSPRDEVSSISWTSRDGATTATTAAAAVGRTTSISNAELRDDERSSREAKLREVLDSIATGKHHGELPETPESTPLTMSPADMMIRHQPNASAHRFVQTILPRIHAIGRGGRRYFVEDAGIELVCSEWAGAVLIDTKAAACLATPSTQSRSLMTASSFSSSRMSRTSSASSHTAVSPPRRTLLVQIACAQTDTKDLRSSILDVLDHATEKLQVDNVVFVVDRSTLDDEQFRAIVHGLCYVGASVVGHGEQHFNRKGRESDEEEDVHAPRHVASGFVLLSVDV